MTDNHCPQCGALIEPGENEDLCPRCALTSALESSPSLDFDSDNDESVGDSPGSSDALESGAKLRYFGDYEIHEELARGGMGVVYRANQQSLNRTVAVKMILSGVLASKKEVKRFRTEAEAAANLKHPNIVSIHEVGEHGGQHFFSMDYVDGESLAQRIAAKGPMPPKEAAETVRTIAEAVQYANQRGILHRDLKPANVLLDKAGKAYVTDFGLAKRTDIDSGLTMTGAVMGSPAYMSPEQARGHHDQVGPASEVFGLGGILFYCLVGRAPFEGESPVAIISQVLNREVSSPSKLNSAIPEDLSTICLKCLGKTTGDRYASAQDLTDELERFLNFEPILAKPASARRRLWNWVQRNPWPILGAAALCLLTLACLAYGLWQHIQQLNAGEPAQDLLNQPVWRHSIGVFWIFVFLPLSLLLSHIGPRFRALYQQHRLSPDPKFGRVRALYIGLGAVMAIYGMSLMFSLVATGVRASQFTPFVASSLLITLPCCLVLAWLGGYMVWEAVGTHETALFSNKVEERVAQFIKEEQNRWTLWESMFFALACVLFAGMFLASTAEQSFSSSPFESAHPLLNFCAIGGLLMALYARGILWCSRTVHPVRAGLLFSYLLASALAIATWDNSETSLLAAGIVGPTMVAGVGILLYRSEKIHSRRRLIQSLILTAITTAAAAAALGMSWGWLGFPLRVSMAFAFIFVGWLGALAFSIPVILLRNRNGQHVMTAEDNVNPLSTPQDFISVVIRNKRRTAAALLALISTTLGVYIVEDWRGDAAWSAYKEELETQGAELDWKKRIPPEIPDEENFWAAPHMEEWLITSRGTSIDHPSFPFRCADVPGGLPYRWEYLLELALTKEGGDALSELRSSFDPEGDHWTALNEALKRPQSRPMGDYQIPFQIPIPSFAHIRRVANVLASSAKVNTLTGNFDEAVADLRRLRDLGDVIENDGVNTLVGVMIRAAVLGGLLVETASEIVPAGEFTPEQIAEIAQLATFDALEPRVVQCMRDERTAMVETLERFKRNSLPTRIKAMFTGEHPEMNPLELFRMVPIMGTDRPARAAAFGYLLHSGWLSQNQLRYCQTMQLFFDRVDPATDLVMYPEKLHEWQDEIEEVVASGGSYSKFTGIAIPNIDMAVQGVMTYDAEARVLRSFVALKLHHEDHGDYPEALTDLTPHLIDDVPTDPFTRRPLNYRRVDENAFVLYSVGKDLRDNNGQPEFDIIIAAGQ